MPPSGTETVVSMVWNLRFGSSIGPADAGTGLKPSNSVTCGCRVRYTYLRSAETVAAVAAGAQRDGAAHWSIEDQNGVGVTP